MKKLLLLVSAMATSTFACGPFFPPSYLNDPEDYFIENINVPMELLLIAKEYKLIDDQVYTDSSIPSAKADLAEFIGAANALKLGTAINAYTDYAVAVRAGSTGTQPPPLPTRLREFTLYLAGFAEMQDDPGLVAPEAWKELLRLDATNRLHRTTWVDYMLGNLAASHGQPEAASEHYAACRQAVRDGHADALGLAHASFKNEHMAQTNSTDRIRCGVQAVAYYKLSGDLKRMVHCLDHLRRDVALGGKDLQTIIGDPICLETATLMLHDDWPLANELGKSPPLKITPRLAWFMYQNGHIGQAEAYLIHCPEDDILANWLRFRIAQRNGQTGKAIDYLHTWMTDLQQSDRIIFKLRNNPERLSATAAIFGNLGRLEVTQGDLLDAVVYFVQAGSYQDAALLAERYLETDPLIAYVDTFARTPYNYDKNGRRPWLPKTKEGIEHDLTYLLARRLFREGRPLDAMPYYPPVIAALLQTYLDARRQAADRWTLPDTRAAHLFHAARIMRWKGMELSGTELGPDYTIHAGNYNQTGIDDEQLVIHSNTPPIYADTAPVPNLRFHYRHIAADLAGKAADLARNRHERATILWSAGEWIKQRYPEEADVYYKRLARIRSQPLAKAADQLRWFPPATPELEAAYRSEKYLSPKELAAASKAYGE